jgi:endonuclease/exonuclease/phosphatase (EEP) superfamily protein YafD
VVLGTVAVVALAWIARSRRPRWLSVVVLAVNVALLLAPLIYASATAPRSSLRIITFNLWGGHNQSPDQVVSFIAQSGADIVVLQEVDARLEGAIVPVLRAVYPYAVSCPERSCDILLLSRREPVASAALDRTSEDPALLWARFSSADGRDFTVNGVHLAWPFDPEWQARQIESLIRRFDEAEGTQIIVGDFNLTPFSWKLNRLAAATGLRRHATFGASWPAFPLFPVVLLDNLLSTPDVHTADVAIGSSGYGSDHRPVTFDLAFY